MAATLSLPHSDSRDALAKTSTVSAPPSYHRIFVSSNDMLSAQEKAEKAQAAKTLLKALRLRQKLNFKRRVPEEEDEDLQEFQMQLRATPFEAPSPLRSLPIGTRAEFNVELGLMECTVRDKPWESENLGCTTFEEFAESVKWLHYECAADKVTTSYCHRRLKMLELNYEFHELMNGALESRQTLDDHGDFDNVTKVDNHLHAASAMTRTEMIKFIKEKMANDEEMDTVVLADGTTLRKCLKSLGIVNARDITTERLDVSATAKMFHRFDNFNDSYNPMGSRDLRTIFMKTDNHIGGRYFAEVMRDVVFTRIEQQPSQVAIEPRLSIYGRAESEWRALADWFVTHKVQTKSPNKCRWMIQVPRLCKVFNGKAYNNFGELLRNIFNPMFQATVEPESHRNLHTFLCHIGGVDCVDDESELEPLLLAEHIPPGQFTQAKNPPYAYWCYYLSQNLFLLNRLREARGLNTLAFKPHCGEVGELHHLASAYLCAESINHGIQLRLSPVMEYLYYCSQIGLALCPISNSHLFLKFDRSPVGRFHKRGLRVTLCTDDPLQFHQAPTPGLEEYIVSAHQFNLNVVDLCEIARNSVAISGFDHASKAELIGPGYVLEDMLAANDADFTNVPDIRVCYRRSNLLRELTGIMVKAHEKTDEEGCWDLGSQTWKEAVAEKDIANTAVANLDATMSMRPKRIQEATIRVSLLKSEKHAVRASQLLAAGL